MYLKLFSEEEGNGGKMSGNKPWPARPYLNTKDLWSRLVCSLQRVFGVLMGFTFYLRRTMS